MTREQWVSARVREREDDLLASMSTPAGRRLNWRIISEWAGLQTLSYAPEDADRDASFREGRRGVGLALYQETQRVCPDLHLLMVTEALEREQKDRADLALFDRA